MKLFFSCDWGTSTFRLRLVNTENAAVLSEIKTGYGIATAFQDWKKTTTNKETRTIFYLAYLLEQVKKITSSFSDPLHDTPVIVSGMASSSIGMLELPYKELPFLCNGSDLIIHTIKGDQDIPHKIIMISGAKSKTDVIRGEETILVGCELAKDSAEQLFIFPGTHSKHITVNGGYAETVTTYMTGELFDLISNKSILAGSIEKNNPGESTWDIWFNDGVKEGSTRTLSNSIFHVRTNQLFKKATLRENYHYLSGLLIGHELKDVVKKNNTRVVLVCNEELKKAYTRALEVLGLSESLEFKNSDDALIDGQRKILLNIARSLLHV